MQLSCVPEAPMDCIVIKDHKQLAAVILADNADLVSNHPVSVLQVTGIMLPLLKFYFQEEVRQAAVQCIPDLLRSAYLAAQKGMQGADANYVRRMVDFIWGPLVEAIGKVLSLNLPWCHPLCP